MIKEVKERILKGKGNPGMDKVSDINVICGVLTSFLKSLREPILTFRMHPIFVKAAGECAGSHFWRLLSVMGREKRREGLCTWSSKSSFTFLSIMASFLHPRPHPHRVRKG